VSHGVAKYNPLRCRLPDISGQKLDLPSTPRVAAAALPRINPSADAGRFAIILISQSHADYLFLSQAKPGSRLQ
jgi:hypothetical protein